MEHLVPAMYGNPRYVGDVNAEEGAVEEIRFELGRDGRLRNDHPYITAVLLLHERDLEREYYDNWRSGWVQSRKPVVRPTQQEIEREVEAWAQHEAGNDVPSGKVYRVDVMTTGSPEAAPVPEGFFNGDRDTRCSVIRE
jgi:hypothetical protein